MKIVLSNKRRGNIFFVLIKYVIIVLPGTLSDSIICKSQTATFSNEFLNIGIDASSLAMGNSIISTINGVCAGYYNPAGLTGMKTTLEVSAMHTNYFSGLAQYDFLGMSYKISDSLALGFSMIRFGVDDIPNTLNLVDENGNIDYDRITYFSVADYAFLFSLSKKSRINNLFWGANIKLIYRRQGEFANAFGFGFDLGIKYSINKWKFGTVLRDATSTFNIWIFNQNLYEEIFASTNNNIPTNSLELTLPKILFGVAREFRIKNKIGIIAEFNFDASFGGKHHSLISSNPLNIDPHLGIQISYLSNIFIRAGIDRIQLIEDFDNSNKLIMQPSLGIGFSFYNFSMDYALTDLGNMTISPVSHIFSLKYAFGKNQSKIPSTNHF